MSSVLSPASFGDLDARLAQNAAAIETLLEALLSDVPSAGEIARPPRLLAAMRHGALGGGKRLRPFLTVETARLLGAPVEQARRAGAAVELLHCYSLVHDDLPPMDDDDLRRGRPTVHRAFDEATAILAGDALLTLAFEVLADEATHESGAVRAALVTCLARASGLGGMVGGQMLDLAAEGRFEDVRGSLSDDAIRQLQAMKTGALLAASVEIGARLGGADATMLAAFGRYGRALGATFQIADDILDVAGDAAALGKPVGSDAKNDKSTYVSLYSLDGARRLAGEAAAAALGALAALGPEAGTLRELVDYLVNRDR